MTTEVWKLTIDLAILCLLSVSSKLCSSGVDFIAHITGPKRAINISGADISGKLYGLPKREGISMRGCFYFEGIPSVLRYVQHSIWPNWPLTCHVIRLNLSVWNKFSFHKYCTMSSIHIELMCSKWWLVGHNYRCVISFVFRLWLILPMAITRL